MPANNCKIMTDAMLKQFNDKYSIVYKAETDQFIVSLKSWNRSSIHDASEKFSINSKKNPKRKIVFASVAIDIFKELQSDDKTKHISIFDVQNAVNKLKVMYQKITKQKILELCMKGFSGIKKI